MRSENGVTLISLIVYMIAMVIIITVVTTITGFFYKNVDLSNSSIGPLSEYVKFNSYLSQDVNYNRMRVEHSGILSNEMDNNISFITLSDEDYNRDIQYTFIEKNNAVYRDFIKIASNVEECTFEEVTEDGKQTITVTMKMIGEDREYTTKYTLKK